jgi:ribonucleases P/MRP protein subunit RPP40
VLNPPLARDIACLESIQRIAILIESFRNKPYDERLRLLGLTTLEKRRTRGDLIETYKTVTGKERVDRSMFFKMADATRGLRGHNMKLCKPRCQTKQIQNWFSVRTVNQWNLLPQYLVDADSVKQL